MEHPDGRGGIELLRKIRQCLNTNDAQITIVFPYSLRRSTPITGARALIDYACQFHRQFAQHELCFKMQVVVPRTSVCSCSRAICDYGAHNQRGRITISVTPQQRNGGIELIWIEELADIVEGPVSSPVYSLLKRADERHVTMAGYDKLVLVESMVREVAGCLRSQERVAAFGVMTVNNESVHNYAALARRSHSTSPTHVQDELPA